MRVFVTGATGFIGSAIARELMAGGHEVLGLARSDEGAAVLAQRGVEAHRGELAEPQQFLQAATSCDGVVHTAFGHDFSAFAAAVETDLRVVEALAGVLEGSGKPLVIASGTLIVAGSRVATERDEPASPGLPRAASEAAIMAAATRGVRSAVVRLSPTVHDATRAGLVTRLAALAQQKGVSAYVGDGANRWPSVHRLDAARLFCLALEKAEPGARLHAVAEEGISLKAMAEAVGRSQGVPARSIEPADAAAHFGPFAAFVTLDDPTSSAITRHAMGWKPREVGLLQDIEAGQQVLA